ncbi:SHOCT domain-containing protein [Nocardia xishanensis]|uniref:SHOCT domain-containing protein n=1 Tax=Nocardia xishanensis TaxID=238964 RepID=UPI0008313EAE|nr:SHOCT domain-containing protein [Nocardia xishanensis]
MPGLLRGVARTAIISGTATAVSNRVSRRQGERWAAEEQRYAPPPSYAPPPAAPQPAPGGGAGAERINALKELAELRAQGVLTDAEFEAEKARILAS